MTNQISAPSPIAVEAAGVSKQFGGVHALRDVSVRVESGTCHAIVGANGAGKSTLMKVLAGLYLPDSGQVTVAGEPLAGGTVASKAAGIALVHQELSLCPDLTVAENICVGTTPTRNGLVDRTAMRRIATALCARLGVDIDPDALAGQLPATLQQFVEIAKALRLDPRILILDEPTASLTPQETDKLLDLLKSLRDEGVTIVYISHRLREIFELCSRATVLRDGRLVEHLDLAESSTDALVESMVGEKLLNLEISERQSKPETFGDVVLSVDNLWAPGVFGTSLEVRAGEVLGLGGLMGSGRTELVRAILGLEPRTRGTVTLTSDGRRRAIHSYSSAVLSGIAFVPEDRRTEGVLLARSVRENLALPSLRALSRVGQIRSSRLQTLATGIVGEVNLKPAKTGSTVKLLSGGNQQKVAFGRWLPTNPRLFVLDEPTAGVDVGAKAEIHELVRGLTAKGTAVIVVSSDLEELLSLSDRIAVLRDGTIAGELSAAEADQHAIVRLGTHHTTPENKEAAHV
ncbi:MULTISPECIES: sugar ABC transporter ATP-binding protein [unclassified Rhodococcus (in: high G+C Gram-positive bacteria)]|uniref:sugar ABC transporter ATP-binding protein n=1 Tax=unclassified Rhodococcus (in: high G+C Gram-positive bacteria) TaxID=192944 RepID=UPI001639BD6F|nr:MULTISPECIES: sugar ABC transporter ATP-binding protein [unclassified Rhodococcus (in: high G+C Gram-positive bacteria)]MBC2637776.1 sugar ABC transporter ATP-binding protein [Rhodococcus sp. 3A]MBC2897479.1 sugar ABC transporter ATP-binding protein [Rhodococcus sp. 4CII]